MTLLLQHFFDFFRIEQVVERVVERAQVGVHFFLERAGQEAEALAGLDGRAHQHDAADFFGVDGGHGHGHGEIGFAGAGRTHAEDHIALLDGLDVFALVDGAGLDGALDARRALLAAVCQRAQRGCRIGDHQTEHSVQLAVVGIDALAAQGLEILEDALDARHARSGPSTCTASERRSMRTPSESSISLRFSSRVPKRGSRLGVISRAIFKGFDGLPCGAVRWK